MKNQDFYDLGNQIQDIVQKAVDSKNYEELNKNIKDALNTAVDSGGEVLRKALEGYGRPRTRTETRGMAGSREEASFRDRQEQTVEKVYGTVEPGSKTVPALYQKTSGERTKGVLMTVFGGILTGSMGIGLMVSSAVSALLGIGGVFGAGGAIMFVGMAAGIGLLAGGIEKLGRLGRFRKYVKALGDKTYADFTALSRFVGKPVKFVRRDIKAMIAKGWFLEGHVDRTETCLITSNETYEQYETIEKQREESLAQQKKAKEEEALREEAQRKKASGTDPKVQEVLDKGDRYLAQIRRCNDDIPGIEMSEKISRIEELVYRIFERVREHPEIIPDLKKMMDYYLPMTVKLLDAYADMDRQPVQGENIRSSKKEIEETLDTLNIAFEKLLDSVFQDTAWDVSSDISVLHTLLAQDGLTGSDFESK